MRRGAFIVELETVIGLEVHAELSTKAKAFCSCPVTFGQEANTACCPVCMGLPGALPRLNKKVVEYAVKLGIATNCTINSLSYHARKNYFYPDLPKGYQITQGPVPLCQNGFLYINGRKIRINRIHIEEDAGKLLHEEGKTLVDYNRAGVPLVEIVTEPDLRTSDEARLFLEKIRQILLYLDISECRMQEGNLRCDVNVSVRKKGTEGYGERCEMKNINSFSAVEKAIRFEENRQKTLLKNGETVARETRRFDEKTGESLLMRNKESAADYRYFTEPDLLGIEVTQSEFERIKSHMPQLPDEKRQRYKTDYNLTDYECDEILKNKSFAKLLEEAVAAGGVPKKVYNYLVSDIARLVNNNKTTVPFSGAAITELTELVDSGAISSTKAKEVLLIMFEENKPPRQIVKEKGFTQTFDEDKLTELVREVIKENEKSVADYNKGKTNALSYLMGQCMRRSDNTANPKVLTQILRRELGK